MKKEEFQISPMTKGYIQIYTGDGKGKTTAALGLAMRAAGAGLRVYIGQFVKDMEYSEIAVIRARFPEIRVELYGTAEGCIYGREADAEDREAARRGLEKARAAMLSGAYDLIILDELTIPVAFGVLPEEEVLAFMREKPEKVELVITGRRATEKMTALADLVTEMKEIRHYYRQGVLSRLGIEC